jgi:uncharacterized protein YdaU (DUF1376 family)
MAEFPSLPLFTDSWVADTKHLTRLERGTYHDLLVLMWRTPDCRVPNDDTWLGKRLGMTPAEVRDELRPLIAEFCQTDGNWVTQKRLVKEWKWCRGHSKKQSDNAKSLWRKKKTLSQVDATTTPVAYAPTPTPTPTPKEEEGSLRSPARKRAVRSMPLADDWALSDSDREFARSAGWLEAKISTEADRFKDHSRARGRTHKDVSAAWRNWVRSPFQQQPGPPNGNGNSPRHGSKEDTRERTVRALDKLTDYLDFEGNDEGGSGEPRKTPVGLLSFVKPARS